MPPPPEPRDLATRGNYPYCHFGTEADRARDVTLAAAHELAKLARFVQEQLRIQAITQDTLARRAGVSQSVISDMLSGRSWPRGSVLVRLVAALGGTLAIQPRDSGQ